MNKPIKRSVVLTLISILLTLGIALVYPTEVEANEKTSAYLIRSSEGHPLANLRWKKGPVTIVTAEKEGKVLAYAIIVGRYTRKGWSLVIQKKKAELDSAGNFKIGVPVFDRTAHFDVVAVGPGKKDERESVGIIFDDWTEFQKQNNVAPIRAVASATATQAVSVDEIMNTSPIKLVFLPGYYGFSLTSLDKLNQASGSLASSASFNFELQVRYRLNPTVETFVFGRLTDISFSNQGTKTLSPSSTLLAGGGLGLDYTLLPSLDITTRLGMEQEFFLRATSLTALTLDDVFIPHLRLSGDLNVAKWGTTQIGLGAGGGLFLGKTTSNEAVQTGYELIGRAFANRPFGKFDGSLSVEYQYKSLGSDLATQTFSGVMVLLGIGFHL